MMLTERFSKNLIYVGLLLIFVFIGAFMWNESFNTEGQIKGDKFGQLGDIVGGFIGSLWALAGVIMLYAALKDHREDIQNNQKALEAHIETLQVQTNEFQLQRIELTETRVVFIEQTKTLKLQQFEQTFFNMLNLHHLIINELRFTHKKKSITKSLENVSQKILSTTETFHKGRDCFKYFYSEFQKTYEKHSALNAHEDDSETIKHSFSDFYEKYQSSLGHYFKNTFKIILLTENAPKEFTDFYLNILKSHISTFEKLLFFYYILSYSKNEIVKEVAAKGAFLEDFPKEDLPDINHIKMMDSRFFGN